MIPLECDPSANDDDLYCHRCNHVLFARKGVEACPRCLHLEEHHDSDYVTGCGYWEDDLLCPAEERERDADDAFDSFDEEAAAE